MAVGIWKGAQHHSSAKHKSKPQSESTSRLLEWQVSREQEIANVDEGVEERELLVPISGNVNWYSHLGNSMEAPQKIKCRPPYEAIPLLSIDSKETESVS